MCIAVGNVSLLDCPMFTWSFGWIGCCEPSVPPASWMHRLEMTSFTFMLDWVPEPVCPPEGGNSSPRPPVDPPAPAPLIHLAPPPGQASGRGVHHGRRL